MTRYIKKSRGAARKTVKSIVAKATATSSVIESKYACDSCGYIYVTSVNGNMSPEDQPKGWSCPECFADSDHFQILVPSDTLDGGVADEDDIDVSKSITAGKRLASIKNKNPDVANLLKRWKRGDLDLQPKFQRYDAWTDKIRSVLVESILLELPIPTIYLAETDDGKFVVVDGQQRLTAIFRFLDNEYKLVGLKALAAYNGKFFNQLPTDFKRRIEDRALDITEIYKETAADVKFSLFERLNRGSVKLNDQELRNCIYRSTYNDFVNELAENQHLKLALHLPKTKRHSRMVDAELTLRFLAFLEQTYQKHPDKKTSEFLNRQMEYGRKGIYDDKQLQRQRKAFNDALEAAYSVYGNNAFRRFRPESLDDPNGSWEPRINRALMDVVLNFFARHPKGTLIRCGDTIRDATISLMSTLEFSDLIKHTISSADRIKGRFEMFEQAVAPRLQINKPDGKRLFSRTLRDSLYDSDDTCSICRNKIMLIDDAEVDHHKPYSKGGKTMISNARLAHRFCNHSAGAKASLVKRSMRGKGAKGATKKASSVGK